MDCASSSKLLHCTEDHVNIIVDNLSIPDAIAKG